MPESIIPSDAVQAIKDSVETQIIEVGDRSFSTRTLHPIPVREEIEGIVVHTLTGFAELVKHLPSDHIHSSSFIQVTSPTVVRFKSPAMVVDDRVVSDEYVTADCSQLTFEKFRQGQYLSQEEFVINLMANFVDTNEREYLLSIVGNIEEEHSVKKLDDGVTQSTEVKTGIRRREEVPIKPIHFLSPYRTFREISQPGSNFLVRIRSGDKCAALFVADGLAWKLEAMQDIRSWLNLQDLPYPVFA